VSAERESDTLIATVSQGHDTTIVSRSMDDLRPFGRRDTLQSKVSVAWPSTEKTGGLVVRELKWLMAYD